MRIGFFLLTGRFDDEKRGHFFMICSLTSADLNFSALDPHPLGWKSPGFPRPLTCDTWWWWITSTPRLLKTYYDATAETPADVLHPTLSLESTVQVRKNQERVLAHVMRTFWNGKTGGRCWGYMICRFFWGVSNRFVKVEFFFWFYC